LVFVVDEDSVGHGGDDGTLGRGLYQHRENPGLVRAFKAAAKMPPSCHQQGG
jgi:hypothetical protein